MRASSAVGLLLVSSVSIFGIVTGHSPRTGYLPSVEPVYVNGVMGVYDPDTGVFVPGTSPLFDATCEKIQLRRQRQYGNYSGTAYTGMHHWSYYPNSGAGYFSYPGAQPFSGSSNEYSSGGPHGGGGLFSGSSRGGIGETGHGFGGGHGGE